MEIPGTTNGAVVVTYLVGENVRIRQAPHVGIARQGAGQCGVKKVGKGRPILLYWNSGRPCAGAGSPREAVQSSRMRGWIVGCGGVKSGDPAINENTAGVLEVVRITTSSIGGDVGNGGDTKTRTTPEEASP